MKQFPEIITLLKSLLISESEVIDNILDKIKNGKSGLFTYFNQNSFNQYFNDLKFREIITDFNCFIDGKGMYHAKKILFKVSPDNFNASDLFDKVFGKLKESGIPVFIIGGNLNSELMKKKLQDKFIISGTASGYEDVDNYQEIVKNILLSGAKVVAVGMGTPRQELFAHKISTELKNIVILCVGNFFNFSIGVTKRAPHILRNSGFEWIYRLLMEPKKLWKRYIIGIPLFMFRIFTIKYLR